MIVDPLWNEDGYLGDLARVIAQSGDSHCMIPLSCTENFGNMRLAGNPQAIRLFGLQGTERQELLEERLYEILARLLLASLTSVPPRVRTADGEPAPVSLFLSHAKKGGGDEIIREIRDFVDKTPLKTFYDARDITSGSDWQKALKENVGRDAVVALITDPYPTREWCRREILMAKEAGSPIVAIVALDKGETRSFPYIGNVPTVVWSRTTIPEERQRSARRALLATIRELLRHVHFRRQCEVMQAQGFLPSEACVTFGSPPELLTFHYQERRSRGSDAKPRLFLYPDPPIGAKEREVLAGIRPDVRLATPTTVAAWTDQSIRPLDHKTIALSISDVDSTELLNLGLGPEHLKDAFVEVSRHLLARGATLAYGGAPKRDFTETLFDLVQIHMDDNELPFERIRSYFAKPFVGADQDAYRARHFREATMIDVPTPPDVDGFPLLDSEVVSPEDKNRVRYAQARHLTAMRLLMTEQVHCRIVLGGALRGFRGRYPGVVEETLIGLRARQPVYIFGGFGGSGRAVAECLMGMPERELTEGFQYEDAEYRTWCEYYNHQITSSSAADTKPIRYDDLRKELQSYGVAGLGNGLSAAENEILFETQNITEGIYYLLKGMMAAQ